MFSKLLKRMTRINLRLAALFSGIFVACSLFLYGFTYFLIYSSLVHDDHENARVKLLEYSAYYRSGGVSLLRSEITLEKFFGEKKLFFLRVADIWNNSLMLLIPERWRRYTIEKLREVDTGKNRSIVRMEVGGERYLLEISSLRLPDGNILQIGIDIEDRERVLKHFRDISVLVIVPLILLSFLGGSVLAARSLRPIHELNTTVKSIIDTGRIEARISEMGARDELGDMVVLFNRMLTRIEKLVNGMREALDSVAHELKTPMTRLRGVAERALSEGKKNRECKEALADCMEESEYILTMLNTLMDISEAETGSIKLNIEIVDISPVIEDIVELYQYVADEKGVSVTASVQQRLVIPVDLSRIRQVLANLLDNAVKYTQTGGSTHIEAGVDRDAVVISVRDTGNGISYDEIDRIWERLYRSHRDRAQPGLGLGLSFVKAIVEAHNGSVRVSSEMGKGSVFYVHLPLKG